MKRITTLLLASAITLGPVVAGGVPTHAASDPAPDTKPLCVDLAAPPAASSTVGYFQIGSAPPVLNVQMELSAPTCAHGVYEVMVYDLIGHRPLRAMPASKRGDGKSSTLIFGHIKLHDYPRGICIVLTTRTQFLRDLNKAATAALNTGCADFSLDTGPGGRFMY